ncbi:DUF418 domain-containing protein [Micromonospora sp. NBC_01699]|uniref:DUF418 domain-containing protein n=1 Tax=Micromonospora sp. NBC_01699 TaxID=2975984 RepID=UPI002E2B05F8|nr:DUF418 domain-containing protein [Micromonospora sp. NBC_01699]
MTPTVADSNTAEPDVTVPTSTPGSPPRIAALDALRGFALAGILLVNIPWGIVTIRMPSGPSSGGRYFAVEVLEYTVQGRFFPIFSFLFGVGFALFLDTAAARSRRPRLVLLRRLAVLGVLGIAHQQLHGGEALLPYAIFGVLVLLPASWLPRWIIAPMAGVALVAGILLGGGLLLIPGLFLLGMTAVRYGIVETLPRRRTQTAVLFCLSAAAAISATAWQAATYTTPNGEIAAAIAGLLGATAYGTGLLLLLGTRVGTVVERVLAPLGRMALTNYVGATLIAAAAGPLLGLYQSAHYGRMLLLAAAILASQALFSRYWLARHRYGPLEWIWRCLTWWARTPNRRMPA